jgi:hypothetical protein
MEGAKERLRRSIELVIPQAGKWTQSDKVSLRALLAACSHSPHFDLNLLASNPSLIASRHHHQARHREQAPAPASSSPPHSLRRPLSYPSLPSGFATPLATTLKAERAVDCAKIPKLQAPLSSLRNASCTKFHSRG